MSGGTDLTGEMQGGRCMLKNIDNLLMWKEDVRSAYISFSVLDSVYDVITKVRIKVSKLCLLSNMWYLSLP